MRTHPTGQKGEHALFIQPTQPLIFYLTVDKSEKTKKITLTAHPTHSTMNVLVVDTSEKTKRKAFTAHPTLSTINVLPNCGHIPEHRKENIHCSPNSLNHQWSIYVWTHPTHSTIMFYLIVGIFEKTETPRTFTVHPTHSTINVLIVDTSDRTEKRTFTVHPPILQMLYP